MPRLIGQLLSEDGDVIANNVEVWINFNLPHQGKQPVDGRFTLPIIPKFDPLNNHSRCTIQLNDGRRGKIDLTSAVANTKTRKWDIIFASNDPLE